MLAPDLKKMLTIAKQKPVSCALGFDKNKNVAMLLAPNKTPSSLVKDLVKETGGLDRPCFGVATISDEDPKQVVLTLNKAPNGLFKGLKSQLKAVGYTSVVIRLEDGTVVGPTAAEDGEAPGAADPAAPPAAAAPPPAPPTPPQVPPAPDAAALVAELTALVRRVPEVTDPAAKVELVKLAKDANIQIKTNNVRTAADLIGRLRDTLRDALDAADVGIGQVTAAQPAAPPAGKGPKPSGRPAQPGMSANGDAFVLNGRALQPIDILVAMLGREKGEGEKPVRNVAADGRRIWREAKEAVDDQVADLQGYLRESEDADLRAVGEYGLAKRTGGLTTALTKALIELGAANDDEKPARSRKALTAVQDYRAFVQGDRVLTLLEDNPFGINVDISGTLDGALRRLEKALAA